MTKRTVRGVVTTTSLEEGETAEVEYTDQVKGLVDNGYAELVDHTDSDSASARKTAKRSAEAKSPTGDESGSEG